jgi:hypothetical protein
MWINFVALGRWMAWHEACPDGFQEERYVDFKTESQVD